MKLKKLKSLVSLLKSNKCISNLRNFVTKLSIFIKILLESRMEKEFIDITPHIRQIRHEMKPSMSMRSYWIHEYGGRYEYTKNF
jgi:hypothetical protein